MIKKLLAVSAASLAACAAIFSGCTSSNSNNFSRYRRTYTSFGTYATLVLEGEFFTDEQKQVAIDIGAEVEDMLKSFENIFSTTVEDSDVCRFNEAAPGDTVEISGQAYTVLSLALDMYEETEGYYNAGVYYSVDLYGFAARPEGVTRPYDRENTKAQLPDDEYVKAFQTLSQSFADIGLSVNNGRYYAVKPQTTVEVEGVTYSLAIDLSGIAKGYAVDIIDDYIRSEGYDRSSFSYGSSSMAANKTYASDNGDWLIEIRDPRTSIEDDNTDDDYFMSLYASDINLSTSGDYENYYIIEDTRYCHIIDPFTGSPIQTGMVMANCIGGTAAEADARTTAIMAMGLDRAIEYINSDVVKASGLKITFIYQNSLGEYLLITNIPEGEYNIMRGNYTVACTIDANGNVVFTGTR